MPGLVNASLEANFGFWLERLDFQFNPDSLEEEFVAEYGLSLPLRASHEVVNYIGTRSQRIPLELFYTAYAPFAEPLFIDPRPGIERALRPFTLKFLTPAGPNPSLEGPARFLRSLMFNNRDRGMLAPPLTTFEWPGIVKMAGRVESLRIRYAQFEQETLQGTVMIANLEFREDLDRDQHITSRSVRDGGSIRGSAPFPSELGSSTAGNTGGEMVTLTSPFGSR